MADGTATAGYVRDLLSREQPTGHVGKLSNEIPRGLSLGVIDPGSPGQYGTFFDGHDEICDFKQDKEDA